MHYVLSTPADGVECFFIEGSEGADDIGCVYGPQSAERENIARLWVHSGKLLADLCVAAETLRRYETLHRAKNTDDSLAKAEANAALASRFEATLAAATGAA